MLVYWIIPETSCTNPPNASHRVRVGGLVLNDKKEVLVVQEKRGIFHEIGLWKIPTGIVEAGEELLAAAVREVKEETGIDTEFVELAFRHADNSLFRKSELFFLCMLRPLSTDDIKKQDLEIDVTKWMPFEEYAAHTEMHEPFKYENELCLAKLERFYAGFSPRHISSYFKEQLSYLYLNSP
ncbi:nudix hydrolase 10-like [Glycine soja]|uniref:nudix hydrolase 10-like n=1 Tax=Glycine soja TaxID=3848 RepID=UPI00103C62E9|nr:nudix hydrolase 10-like [Glycine soja]